MKKKYFFMLLFICIIMVSGCANNGKEIDIFDSLPKLTVSTDTETIIPLYLEHTWRWKNCNYVLNGNSNPFLGAPLKAAEYMATLKTKQREVTINFDRTPDNILEVNCWRDVAGEEIETKIENVNYNSEIIELKKGSYTYKITAEWTDKSDKNGYGQISYCFHVNAEY